MPFRLLHPTAELQSDAPNPVDVEALIDTTLGIACFLEDAGDIVDDVAVNPVIVGAPGQGAVAVDALIILNAG